MPREKIKIFVKKIVPPQSPLLRNRIRVEISRYGAQSIKHCSKLINEAPFQNLYLSFVAQLFLNFLIFFRGFSNFSSFSFQGFRFFYCLVEADEVFFYEHVCKDEHACKV